MKINLKDIKRNSLGDIEEPVLVLKTLHENTIGAIGDYFNLEIALKYNELSEVTFDVPSIVDGEPNPLYDRITGFKILQIDPFGKFILMNPTEQDDGIRRIKSCTAKSLEYEFSRSNIVLEEGTYCLYNPADTENTIMGIILSEMPGWGMGSVDQKLICRYRTFSDTDDSMLSFLYGEAQKSYNCLFVFDTNNRTIDIVDADNDNNILPIYLSFDNFVKEVKQEELSDGVFTVLNVYGADPVTINSVNPTGGNKLYNLDWFISNGDIEEPLVSRWRAWETLVESRQDAYATLLMLRTSETSRLITQQAKLTDLNSDLTSLSNLRDVISQGVEEGLKDQDDLDEVISQYKAKEKEIAAKETEIESINSSIMSYTEQITAIANECKLKSFFTTDEYMILQNYFQETSFTDETYAVYNVDIAGDSNSFYESSSCKVSFSDAEMTDVPMDSVYDRRLFAIKGGSISVASSECTIEANIVDGTFERKNSGDVVASFYLNSGTLTAGDSGSETTFLSGTLTLTGTVPSFTDLAAGATFSDIDIYFTRNVTEYQTYSVEKELYEYVRDEIVNMAQPSFSFDVDAANIVFARESEPFKDNLRLGSSVYLQLNEETLIKPLLLEVHLDYEKPENFSMVFSNEYKRPDCVNTLKDVIKDAVDTTRKLDMTQYEYGAFNNSGANTFVSNLIQYGLDASKQSITNGVNNNVVIDGKGLRVMSDNDPAYIHMNNGGIYFVDSDTGDVKMGVGRFKDSNVNTTGTIYGIIAPNIVGTLLAGENLVIECKDSTGTIVQFKIDSTGAFLNNSRFYLQKDGGGKIAIDPAYGIAAGTSSLYSISGTTVTPTFLDSNGDVDFVNGMPKNTNFFLDLRDGNAYFKGTVYATTGYFSGTVQATDFLDQSGKSMLNDDYQITSDYLDVKGLNVNNRFIIDSNGNVTIKGGSIAWSAVEGTEELDERIDDAQEEAAEAKTLIEKMADGEYYNGTFIDGTHIYSPTIYSNEFNVVPESKTDPSGAFNIYGAYGGNQHHVLSINYYAGTAPYINFESPCSGYAEWWFPVTTFHNNIDFSDAKVTGLDVTAKFA